LDFAFKGNNPSYQPHKLEILRQHANVKLLDQEGVVDGYIHYQTTAAHSPYHQVFRIVENGQIIFYGGDDAPQLQQMKSRFVAKYDYDGRKTMMLRSEWWKRGLEEHWTFLFYHDIKSPTISL
jgi:hypothetical protein